MQLKIEEEEKTVDRIAADFCFSELKKQKRNGFM